MCPSCGKRFETLKDLKIHFKKHDASYCPICRKNYKKPSEHYIKHYQKTKDERHLVLYYLSANLYKNHTPINTKLYKIALEKARKYLGVKEWSRLP
nr:hypothetical protein [Acidianus hospitalis]